MLDLSWTTYVGETAKSVNLTDLFGGVFKSAVYGVLIAVSGCLRGINAATVRLPSAMQRRPPSLQGSSPLSVPAAFSPSSSMSWGFDIESNQKEQLTEISKLEIRNSKTNSNDQMGENFQTGFVSGLVLGFWI